MQHLSVWFSVVLRKEKHTRLESKIAAQVLKERTTKTWKHAWIHILTVPFTQRKKNKGGQRRLTKKQWTHSSSLEISLAVRTTFLQSHTTSKGIKLHIHYKIVRHKQTSLHTDGIKISRASPSSSLSVQVALKLVDTLALRCSRMRVFRGTGTFCTAVKQTWQECVWDSNRH